MATLKLPFTLERPSTTDPTTKAGDVDLSTAIEGIASTTVQGALVEIYNKAKEGGLTDAQIAAAISTYLLSHPIEGVVEAPTDGKQYARKDGLWAEVQSFSGNYDDLQGKPDLSNVGVQADWNETDNTKDSFIKNKPTTIGDAPTDGKMYLRKNGSWVEASGVGDALYWDD